MADQAAAALDRTSRWDHFTSLDDLVFCNVYGRPLDDSALRRRYRRAQAASGVQPLRSSCASSYLADKLGPYLRYRQNRRNQ
jgi:hypothetical protein